MHSFWSYNVFVAETSIFLIAGVLVGANILKVEDQINQSGELLIIFYVYVIAMLARFVSIAVFMKWLRRIGDGMNWREVIIMTFAGLKGAIGVSLAMLVFNNMHHGELVRGLILLHVTGNSILTLFINGMSTGLLVQFLGVSTLKKVEYKLFREYLSSFER